MATQQGRPKSPQSTVRGRQAAPKRSFPLVPALIGGALALVGLILLILWLTGSLTRSGTLSGTVAEKSPGGPVPTMPSRNHTDAKVQYTTNPPTSGDHAPAAATWGTYPKAPPDERLVHNLEHGGVIISYNPAKVDEPTVQKLKDLTADLRSGAKKCLILTPRASIQDDKPIALTSWGVLATLDSFDEGAIRAFWRDHVAHGPELGEGVCG